MKLRPHWLLCGLLLQSACATLHSNGPAGPKPASPPPPRSAARASSGGALSSRPELASLTPEQRAVAVSVLKARLDHDAPVAAALAGIGRNRDQILAVLGPPPCKCKEPPAAAPAHGEAAATPTPPAVDAPAADEPAADEPAADEPAAPAAVERYKANVPPWAPQRGPRDAKVTIVVWSDFQCPFCARLAPTLVGISKRYGDSVRVVFRNFPLPFHEHALEAAEAAMAAAEQGRFWPMHDRIFRGQPDLSTADLERYAKQSGLNLARYRADAHSHRFRAQILNDVEDGLRLGATGTPTLFVNGRRMLGAVPFLALSAVVEEELARADHLLDAGTKPSELYDTLLKGAIERDPNAPAADGSGADPSGDQSGDPHGGQGSE